MRSADPSELKLTIPRLIELLHKLIFRQNANAHANRNHGLNKVEVTPADDISEYGAANNDLRSDPSDASAETM